MIIYNVTLSVDKAIADEWLNWLKDEHIPEVMNTHCFSGFKLVQLLEVDDSEGPTYAVQYFAESMADYNRYIELHAAALRQKSFDKWGNRFMAFRSVMKEISN